MAVPYLEVTQESFVWESESGGKWGQATLLTEH